MVRREPDSKSQKAIWDLVMDPTVTPNKFQRLQRDYLQRQEELGRAKAESLSRREFISRSAQIVGAFGSVAAIGSGALGTRSATAQTTKAVSKGTIRIGYIASLDCELLEYVIEKKGILQSMGWNVKFLAAASGPQVMEAFIGKEIDFAYVGSNTAGLAAQKGILSKAVAGGMAGHGGWGVSNALYEQGVRDIPSYMEMARKRKAEGKPISLAVQVPGTLTHAAAMITLKNHGLDPDRDLDVKFLPPPEVASTLVSGVVESNSMCEQYATYPEYYNKGKVIGHCIDGGANMMQCDGLPEQTYVQCVVMAVRPGMPDEMVQAVVEAHKKAAEFVRDNVKESLAIAAAVAGTPGPVEYTAMYNRTRWHYGVNWESCDSVWNDTMRKLGLASKKFKLDELVDTKNSVELKPGYESIAGVNAKGPTDVTSDRFRSRVWGEAKQRYATAPVGLSPFARRGVNGPLAGGCGFV